MSLKEKAKEVLRIVEQGGYRDESDEWIDIKELVENAVENTCLYHPEDFDRLTKSEQKNSVPPQISVTAETTQIATLRLIAEGCRDLVLLNFASARNPGGGFLNGAKAQEEDLSRCSALYHCLVPQTTYYDRNREQDSMLYTDTMIYSPEVPWFRTRSRDAPHKLFVASVITAPAPNAGQARLRGISTEEIRQALHRRCGMVLGIARDRGHRSILLGAWGCGVFGNDPAMVADCFNQWLNADSFTGSFDQVTFAIYDRTRDKKVLREFEAKFAG